jgi:paraquat-inducible protein A
MLRWLAHLEVWSMLEVVMLGILVALVKIAQLASVNPGIGMYAFGVTILLIPAIAVSLDRRKMWQSVEWVDAEIPSASPSGPAASAK